MKSAKVVLDSVDSGVKLSPTSIQNLQDEIIYEMKRKKGKCPAKDQHPCCFNWERIAYYVDSKLPSGVSYCIPPISGNFVRTSLQ